MSVRKIVSFHVIGECRIFSDENYENYNSEDDIITWTYPTITQNSESHLLQNLDNFCTRKQNIYYYIVRDNEDDLIKIAFLSTEFDPEKYRNLCKIFAVAYRKEKDPVDLVKLYVNLTKNGEFSHFKSATNLKEFIKSFNFEIVLLYIAILLKKRVVFYNPEPSVLHGELFTVTKLVPCRRPTEYLHPLVDNLRDFKGLSFFISGTSTHSLIRDENLYDLFVDLETREINISSKSRDLIAMARTQKDLAIFLMKLAESDFSEEQVQEELSKKCKQVVDDSLDQFGEKNRGKMVTLSDLKSKGYSEEMQDFVFNLAVAENRMIL